MAAAKTRAAAAKKPPLNVLSKEALLAADDLEQLTIDVPEWKGAVTLRQIKRQEVVDCQKAATSDGKLDEDLLQLYQLASSMVEPSFTREEITALGEKNASVVGSLIAQMLVLQGGGADSLKEFNKSLLD